MKSQIMFECNPRRRRHGSQKVWEVVSVRAWSQRKKTGYGTGVYACTYLQYDRFSFLCWWRKLCPIIEKFLVEREARPGPAILWNSTKPLAPEKFGKLALTVHAPVSLSIYCILYSLDRLGTLHRCRELSASADSRPITVRNTNEAELYKTYIAPIQSLHVESVIRMYSTQDPILPWVFNINYVHTCVCMYIIIWYTLPQIGTGACRRRDQIIMIRGKRTLC